MANSNFNPDDILNPNIKTLPPYMRISVTKSLLLLACLFVVGYMLTVVITFAIMPFTDGARFIRFSTIAQDLLAFIAPALLVAVIASQRPAELLGVMKKPHLSVFIVAAITLLVAIPAQDAVIYWNYNWSWLPSNIDSALRSLEFSANETLKTMLGDTSIPALIINILIIGVAAGFSEEILFRGALLGLLFKTKVSKHVSIWLVAFIFSAVHLQVFGFVPRMLLGAFFGYLFYWSKSIWLPMFVHALNNTIVVIVSWHSVRTEGLYTLDQVPSLHNIWITIGSVLATIALLYLLHYILSGKAESHQHPATPEISDDTPQA